MQVRRPKRGGHGRTSARILHRLGVHAAASLRPKLTQVSVVRPCSPRSATQVVDRRAGCCRRSTTQLLCGLRALTHATRVMPRADPQRRRALCNEPRRSTSDRLRGSFPDGSACDRATSTTLRFHGVGTLRRCHSLHRAPSGKAEGGRRLRHATRRPTSAEWVGQR
jgi:hypothetical protein